MGDWSLDPLQLAPIVMVGVAYGVRARTLERRGSPVPRWKIALFALGLLLLLVAVVSPIAALGEERFFVPHAPAHPPRRPRAARAPRRAQRAAAPAAARGAAAPRAPRARPPARRAADLGREPLPLAPPVRVRRRDRQRLRARARASVVLHGGPDHVGTSRRGAARTRVVRDGGEARLHRRRPARRDRARERLPLVGRGLLLPGTRTSGSPTRRLRARS